MTQRVGTNLRKPLHDFPRQPGNTLEWKIGWNPAALVAASALDLALLTPDITRVLDAGFGARQIDAWPFRIQIQRNLLIRDHRSKARFRAAKQLGGRKPIAGVRSDPGVIENLQVILKA
jgi:hypothetical protein